ncbi:MAG: TraU family protein [Chromatiales bacterium]|nr:TraU family protein [Chromatiales bacterium]
MRARSGLVGVVVGLLLVVSGAARADAPCHGRFPNPFTDICWKCVFPISIGPLRVDFGMEDAGDRVPLLCTCPGPPPLFVRVGLGVGLWEPARVAEVVRTPFCSPLLGGVRLASLDVPDGMARMTSEGRDAFYHVHWYAYPLLAWMNLLTDISCLTPESFDLLYMTELDPLWDDEELAFLLNPEAVLFANPPAQAACAADCAAASAGFPLDSLFWCAGCQGSMYPMSGTAKPHEGVVDSSLLLVQRMAAKLHRQFIARDTSSREAMCMALPLPILRKSQYKTQMLFPTPFTERAHPLGRVTQPWSAGREFPARGEDAAYLVWRKRACCAF